MKNTASLVLTFFLASSLAWAATTSSTTQGILTSVTGKVQIKGKDGKKPRTAKKDSTVVEGERIVTDPDAKATLQLFDGSELNISPKTDFQLTKMQKPSGDDKILQFKLFVGRLFAKVKKLSSSKSSFEVEAGGVVCGVSGGAGRAWLSGGKVFNRNFSRSAAGFAEKRQRQRQAGLR